MDQLVCDAKVVDFLVKEDRTIIVLDQTVFYPQGGGQPWDTGVIKNETSVFVVEEVRYVEGRVYHIGVCENGELEIGNTVTCIVEPERRRLNTRLHSAGHVVDMALKALSISWIPGKGYHFPNGPYVEYEGSIEGYDIEKLRIDIEQKCNEIVNQNIDTTVIFDDLQLQNGKPMRTVYYGDFGIPCGGTHVMNLGEVGKITIRKIKQDKAMVRISYVCDFEVILSEK